MKHTKILATIAGNKCDIDFLKSLFDKGMNAVRINTAHQDIKGAEIIINKIRKVSNRIAIVLDTKGPEIRSVTLSENLNIKNEK